MKKKYSRAMALAMAGLLTASSATMSFGTNIFASDGTTKDAQTVAFPGAEGGGMYATGGRGYDVYTVTNLDDYALGETPIEGSLRYGIENAKDGMMIVFNVAGTIHLKQTLTFRDKKNITLAGQTAPGDGVTLAGYDTNISNSQNLIIRYMRFRPGAENVYSGGDSMDALWGRDNDTFIIDHCSFSWNTDETLSTYRGKNGTVQWCIISESLTCSGHTKGRHGYGGIFGGDNTVFQYNLIANHTSRSPRIGGGSMGDPTKDGGSMATLQISNNVVYNWGYLPCYGGGFTKTNYVNNYLKAGLGTRDDVDGRIIQFGENNKTGSFYVAGNVVEGNEALTADNQKGVVNAGQTTGATLTTQVFSPLKAAAFDQITMVSANDCVDKVLNSAGATFPERDAIDARVVEETKNNTGSYINTEDEVGGYSTDYSARPDNFDTDKDGIPDYWETEKGLNPSNAADGKLIGTDGYSNLEHYLNSLVEGTSSRDYVAPNPTTAMDLATNTQVAEGTAVTVNATATANNGGSIAKVEFYNGIELVATDTEAPYSCTYSGLTDGTYNISVRAYDNDGNETQSTPAKLHVNSTASTGDWTSKDIGTPGVKGTASLNSGVLTVKGSGKLGKAEGSVSGTTAANAKTDDFQYTYQKVTGDVELVTKLDYATTVDNHVFTGIMFRESLDNNAKAAALGMSLVKLSSKTSWSTYLASRKTTGGNMSELSETLDSAGNAENAGIPLVADITFKNGKEYNGTWFKLTRHGNLFTGYTSADGQTWTKVGSQTIEMADTFYIGFAVDSNQVANQLHNLSTAKFSNISIDTAFEKITYNVENVKADGVTSIVPGETLSVQLKTVTGYNLPETVSVTMDGQPVTAFTYDKESGLLNVPNVTGAVVITASGVQKEVAGVTFEEVDDNNLLTIDKSENKLVLTQTAESGQVAKNSTTPAVNESYLLFPETAEGETLTMKLKVTNYGITGSAGKNTGVFVGAFDVDKNIFASIGFRGHESSVGTDSLSPYWTKSKTDGSNAVGNGSPKAVVGVGDEYEVEVKRSDAGVLSVKFNNLKTGEQTGEKTFADSMFAAGDKSQLGIGIIGATAEVSDMKLTNSEGIVVYDQTKSEEVVVNPWMPVEVDDSNVMSMEAAGSVMKLSNTATEGQIAQSTDTAGVNTSYLLFPETKEGQKLSLNLKVTNYRITGAEGKMAGAFVGAFDLSRNAFATLGFRGHESSVGTDSLSGYWTKATGKAGNGSPKYVVGIGDEYKVTFTKNSAGYIAKFENLSNPLEVTASGETYSNEKQFKTSEMVIASSEAVRYGIALCGADVEVTNMVLEAADGTVLYNQADYFKESGTAPAVTNIAAPVISDDRSEITVSWTGEGASGDGQYLVEVSTDNGETYTVLGKTKETSFTYKPKKTADYRFRISGVCGNEATEAKESAAAVYLLPMTAPTAGAKSGNGQCTVTWNAVSGAVEYNIYRAEADGAYTKVGTTSELTYTDTTAVNEVPYFYTVQSVSASNTSNPSKAVSIMATAGHTGEYVFGKDAPVLTVSDKSSDTTLGGSTAAFAVSADRDGKFEFLVNGTKVSEQTVTKGTKTEKTIDLADGRNEVRIVFTGADGKKTYQNLNFVKLNSVDMIVDGAYTGTDGAEVDGVATYKTVTAAVAAVPADNAEAKVIFVKNGSYKEKLTITTPYISLIGEDAEKTKFYYDVASGSKDENGKEYGTSGSGSLIIESTATGFTAENITISNDFDYAHATVSAQAVAFYNKADKSMMTNVKFYGYQDTLFADGNNRQYYNKCYIEGCVDFIFGNAQAVFADCDIVSNRGGYVTAASTESVKNTGYVFLNCRLLATDGVADGSVYLGRPWRTNACVTYINCYMGSQISSKGYTDMSGALYKDAQFYEYGSYGEGFTVNSDRRQLSKAQAEALDSADEVFAKETSTAGYNGAWTASSDYTKLSEIYGYKEVVVTGADYSAVDAAIAKANALVKTDYKDFSQVTAAINAVNRELTSVDQAQVDAMAKAIEDAINALEKKPAEQPTEKPTEQPTEQPTEKPTEQPTEKPTEQPTEQPTQPSKPEDESKENSTEAGQTGDGSAQTGDRSMTGAYAALLGLSLAGAALAASKKKKPER